jgi:hypothetical protein
MQVVHGNHEILPFVGKKLAFIKSAGSCGWVWVLDAVRRRISISFAAIRMSEHSHRLWGGRFKTGPSAALIDGT